ncbi:thymidylate synthase [Ignicoccus pacificus DSM 13166]|uniref:FAD-dependent thymidylate synthase n=1 Tax=Ignicoccus pacificus DSM 13166 TaxID=940294 RepID=A0A977K9B0_9CREN|nr:thymidylate synthase [Ignicoccus pacificus DSM 13166]
MIEEDSLICVPSPMEKKTTVCLIAYNKPLLDEDPRRLPLLAVKTSTGKVIEKGIWHYLTREWKEGWSGWLSQAPNSFPSVLEHITFTFFIDGISRVTSHQLVRHRLVSFTQESQRYTENRILKVVDAKDLEDAFAKWSAVLGRGEREVVEELCVLPVKDFWRSCAASVLEYLTCRINGKRMEDCRYALPQAVRTSIMMTLNARELLHVIELRADRRAQWEIRGVALALKDLARRIVPEIFTK